MAEWSMAAANDKYKGYPEHSLHEVPQEILDAARKVLREAADYKDVDPDFADPIADSVVSHLKPWLRWEDNTERVLRKILNDPTLDVTVNIGGYLVFFVDDGHGDVMSAIIDLTPEQLALCQRLQGEDDG